MSCAAPVEMSFVRNSELLADATAAAHRDRVDEVRLRAVEDVLLREAHRHAEGAPARDDAHLVERVRVREEQLEEGVPGLVPGRGLVFAARVARRLALAAPEHLVARLLEDRMRNRLEALARGEERGLVDDVREVGAGVAARAAREALEVHVVRELHLRGVDREDGLAALERREVHVHLAVEAAGAQERGVEDVRAVRGGDHDHAVVRAEAVHLHEHRVERLVRHALRHHAARVALRPRTSPRSRCR